MHPACRHHVDAVHSDGHAGHLTGDAQLDGPDVLAGMVNAGGHFPATVSVVRGLGAHAVQLQRPADKPDVTGYRTAGAGRSS
jgi:hypothetical protein